MFARSVPVHTRLSSTSGLSRHNTMPRFGYNLIHLMLWPYKRVRGAAAGGGHGHGQPAAHHERARIYGRDWRIVLATTQDVI